jgi:hypothetical protein
MAAKKGKGGVGGEARRAAKQMSKEQIKDFLKKKGAAYEAGFLQKCAEANVDPEQLAKKAARLDQVQRALQLLFRNSPSELRMATAKLPMLSRGSGAASNAASDMRRIHQALTAPPEVLRQKDVPRVLQRLAESRQLANR